MTSPYTITGLSCRRGGRVVLEDVAFSLAPGAAITLRGPNGAGKTTLLRTLAGLSAPASGDVDPGRVAYAGHADGLKAQLTVAENLVFWAAIFGTRDIGPAVEAFDLSALLSRRTADLSAGQRRRAGLARLALTARPVWLLDEPTVSLDTVAIDLFTRALAAHLSRGGIAIVATHLDLDIPDIVALDVTRFAARNASAAGDPFAEAIE